MGKITTSPWRKLSIAIYGAPLEGKVYGTYDVDVTNLMKYIKKRRNEGVRLTVTQFVTAALGKVFSKDAPEVNCYVRRGKIVYRDSVDVSVAVLKKGGRGQTTLLVKDAQDKTVSEIAKYMDERLEAKRAGEETGFFKLIKILAKVPWPFRRIILKMITWWIFDMEFPVPGMKKQTSPFGSTILTNIGTFGLKTGMVALFPIGKLPGVITMGRAQDTPVVIDGEIKIRKMLPFTGTFDHRMVDGAQIGKVARGIQKRLRKPELLDQKKEEK